MSAKNRRPEKKVRAMQRAIRKGRLPTKFSLEQWLIDRNYAKTKKEAREVLLAGFVMHESHPLGKRIITDDNDNKYEVYDPFVSSDVRGSISVKLPKRG